MKDARLRRPPQVGWKTPAPALPPEEKDERYTPPKLLAWVAEHLGVPRFELDVAACDEAHVAPRYYTKHASGLLRPWDARTVWCNPPFSKPFDWTHKAWAEASRRRFHTLVMLLPAMRQEQPGWQRDVEAFRDGRGHHPSGYVLTSAHPPGRWAFTAPGGVKLGPAGFPIVFLKWTRRRYP